MDQESQSWQKKLVLRTAGIAAAAVFLALVFYSYRLGWKWTGIPQRTLWDWLNLLIVPIVLTIGGYLFTRSENRATQAAAERRAQDDALQAYLDNMSDMLTPNKDQPSLYEEPPPPSLKTVARARTLTVLSRLAGTRKARVVQFLYEAGLISKSRAVLELRGANLSNAALYRADLRAVDLRRVMLWKANLSEAKLSEADLRRANLFEAHLESADLRGANLSRVLLWKANLKEADLGGAYLNKAILFDADLKGADLTGADLTQAKVAVKQLSAARSLEGTTMTDGQTLSGHKTPNEPTFENWLKERGLKKSSSVDTTTILNEIHEFWQDKENEQ